MSAEKDKFSYLGTVTILLPTDHDVVSHFESEKSELGARANITEKALSTGRATNGPA